MGLPVSQATLRRYGCTGPIKPSFDTTKAFRANNLRHLVPRVSKPVLPEHYDEKLIIPLPLLEGLSINHDQPIKGVYPISRDVNPQTELLIDRNYQRQLTASDLAQIETIANNFDMERVKALTCFSIASNLLKVTDGQRTALAARLRGITRLPALVYTVPQDEGIAREANSFVGINLERRAVPSTELLTALIISGQPDIVEFANIVKAHKIKPRERTAVSGRNMEANETCCIGVLQSVFFNTERDSFLALCAIISRVGYRPIKREHIWAVKTILQKMSYDQIDFIRINNAIRSIVDKHAILEARDNARNSKQRTTVANELANIYLRRYNNRAKALNAD